MKYLLSILSFAVFNVQAATLSWDQYSDNVANFDPQGYEVMGECTKTTTQWVDVKKVKADKTSMTFTLLPGESGKCRIRAHRISDNQFSDYSGEVAYSIPLGIPAAPTGITISIE